MKLLPVRKINLSWFYSLRTRFILLVSVILVAIFSLIAFFLVANARNTLTSNLNREVKAFSSLAVQPVGDAFVTYQQSGSLLIDQQMQKFTFLDSNVSNIAIVGLDGKSLFSLNNEPVKIPATTASNFMSTSKTNSKGQTVQIVQPYFDDSGVHSYAVVYTISTLSVDRSITHEEDLILMFTILGLIVSAVATYVFLNGLFIKPVEKVSESAQLIAGGSYDQQIQYKRHDEIGALATSVNRMANALKADINKLEEVDKLKTEFISIASHNLRTPLTIIQGYIDLLKTSQTKSTQPDAAIGKAVEAIDSSARDLNNFSEQMLTISSISSNHDPAFFKEVTLEQFLQPLADEYAKIAKDKSIEFKFATDGDNARLTMNQEQLSRAVRNLLNNGIKFTKAGGLLSLIGHNKGSLAVIEIADTGIGIDAAEIPKLFTKFHRATSTMTYDYEGIGLGLYVTKLIVEEHKGSVSVESQLGKGSLFKIELPTLSGLPSSSEQNTA